MRSNALRVVAARTREEVIHSGDPHSVVDDDGGVCDHTYSALCQAIVAADLRSLGFIGAEQFVACHDVVDVAWAVADIKQAVGSGQKVRNAPGMVRYLVSQWARERRRRRAVAE